MLFNSRELFKLRQVSTEWNDLIKVIWCQVVKEEMLEQVQNLDLLYEKETTAKLLEFKLKYLVSYAQLMRNYFVNMVFADILGELVRIDEAEENADLNNLGQKMIVITCMIVSPGSLGDIPTANEITSENITQAKELMLSDPFKEKFRNMCGMDIIPEITI